MGVCLARSSRSQPIHNTVFDPQRDNTQGEKLQRVLTMCKPPEAMTASSGRTASQDVEENRGILMLSNLSMWMGGALSPLKEREFEEKKTTCVGDSIPLDFLKELGVAATCKKGLKPESPNQDDYCIAVHDSALILGVFDGHGPAGHEVASFVSKVMPQVMAARTSFRQNPADAIMAGFQMTQNDLLANLVEGKRNFDCIYSGTTATLAVLTLNSLTIGHVGDSKAVLGTKDPTTGQITAVSVTIDHKPLVVGEKERILSAGGEIRTLEGDSCYRVFFHGKDFPGLAITRALGDVMTQSLGVIPTPDIYQHDISANDEFLLICSDGVWEFITADQAVRLVWEKKQEKVHEAAEELAKLAWKSWLQSEEGIVDDITVMIAYFRPNVD